jgi:hypothetical protein
MHNNTESSNDEMLDRRAPETPGSPLQSSASFDRQGILKRLPDTGCVTEESSALGKVGERLLAWKTGLKTLSESLSDRVTSRVVISNCSSRARARARKL